MLIGERRAPALWPSGRSTLAPTCINKWLRFTFESCSFSALLFCSRSARTSGHSLSFSAIRSPNHKTSLRALEYCLVSIKLKINSYSFRLLISKCNFNKFVWLSSVCELRCSGRLGGSLRACVRLKWRVLSIEISDSFRSVAEDSLNASLNFEFRRNLQQPTKKESSNRLERMDNQELPSFSDEMD